MELEKKISVKQSIKNILYAFRIVSSIDRKYIIHTLFVKVFGYFIWVFNSVYYVRFIVDVIEQQMEFSKIVARIIFIGITLLLIHAYNTYVYNVFFPAKEPMIYKELYKRLYKKAENVELECFEDSKFYNNYTMALEEAYNRISSMIGLVCDIVSGIVFGVISSLSMFRIDKFSILFIIFPIVGNFLIGAWQNRYYYARDMEGLLPQRKIAYVNRVMYLSDYAKEIRLFGIFHLLHKMYSDSVKQISMLAKKYSKKLVLIGMIHYLFSYTFIFEGLLFYISYITIVHKSISLAEFAVITSIMVTASYIWINVMNAFVNVNKNSIYIMNLRTFLDYNERIPEDSEGIIPNKQIESIEFVNVSFSYSGSEKNILNNISFKTTNLMSTAIVGFNGAGKSTLMKLLLRLYDPTSGKILVNGIDIKEYNLQEYRKLFSVAFQDYKMVVDSIENNILMGRMIEDSSEKISQALKKVGLWSKIDALPKKLNNIVTKEFDEDGAVFSGGEMQKLAVARAMVNQAPIKIYDEPTSALDPIAENELFECIFEDGKKSTTFYISHRLSSTKNADQILLIKNGSVAEKGTHTELMDLKGEYYAMFEKQAQNYLGEENMEAECYEV